MFKSLISFLHARRLIAAVAPAEARSCRALTLLVTRGRLLLFDASAGPVLVRLLPVELLSPLMTDWRRGAVLLLGLVSRVLTAVPFLKLVAGGSGRGLGPTDGVVMVLCRLIGESFRAGILAVGTDDF